MQFDLPLLLVFQFYPFSYHRAPVEHNIVVEKPGLGDIPIFWTII